MAAALDHDGMDSYPAPDSNDILENGGNLFAPDNDMEMDLPNINAKVSCPHWRHFSSKESRSQGCKTFFMLHSAEHEIFSANKYENAKNSLHFYIC